MAPAMWRLGIRGMSMTRTTAASSEIATRALFAVIRACASAARCRPHDHGEKASRIRARGGDVDAVVGPRLGGRAAVGAVSAHHRQPGPPGLTWRDGRA